MYEASATLLVNSRGGGGFSLGDADFSRSTQLATTYERLVTAAPFPQRVQQSGQLPNAGALGSISASSAGTPPLIEIRARNRSPEVASVTAQVVAEEFIDYTIERRLAEIARIQVAAAAQGLATTEVLVSAQLGALDTLSLLEPVRTPGRAISPNVRQSVLLGSALGLMMAVGVILL